MVSHLEQADLIVKKYMNWSFVGGLIPIPLVDLAAVSGIQVKMLYDLAKLYDVQFKTQAAQSAVASLLGSVVPGVVTNTAPGSNSSRSSALRSALSLCRPYPSRRPMR